MRILRVGPAFLRWEMRRFWNYDDHFDDILRAETQKCYFGLVSFLDDNIRRVLASVEKVGSISDTVILYMSDHGEMLGHLGFWTKSVMYEYASGILLIACGPGFRQFRCDTPVSLTDIGATVEYCAGSGMSGSGSWQPQALQTVDNHAGADRVVLSQYHDGGTPESFYMIRHRNWKYVHYAGGNRPQLFNLQTDPMELNDLGCAESHRVRRQLLHRQLLHILDPDEVADQCASDQAAKIKRLGGREMLLATPSFNHTPVD